MKTLEILQYVSAMLAMAAMVASFPLEWGLSAEMFGLLGGWTGLMMKRPSDTSTAKKALPAE